MTRGELCRLLYNLPAKGTVNTVPLQIEGVVAALLTPRTSAGEIDEAGLERNIRLVMESGVTGVCVNGATGEYVHCTVEERMRLVVAAKEALRGRGVLIAGIGGANWEECVRLGEFAFENDCAAVLAPPPHFFRYDEHGLECYYRNLASSLKAPVLLYNLPQFTSPIPPKLAVRLIREVPGIAGIKDSSGNLDILRELAAAGGAKRRIVGHDGALGEAFESRCLHGVISGVAGVLPELTVSIYQNYLAGDKDNLAAGLTALAALIEQLEKLPVPWALKVIAEARGLFETRFAWPVCVEHTRRFHALRSWFEEGHCQKSANEQLPGVKSR